jgi:hypothetical protein
VDRQYLQRGGDAHTVSQGRCLMCSVMCHEMVINDVGVYGIILAASFPGVTIQGGSRTDSFLNAQEALTVIEVPSALILAGAWPSISNVAWCCKIDAVMCGLCEWQWKTFMAQRMCWSAVHIGLGYRCVNGCTWSLTLLAICPFF